MSDTLLVTLLGFGLSAVATVPVVVQLRRSERRTDEAEAVALEYGLNEPVSLHPVIDPDRCIGTGSCVDVCPEGRVIGIRDGQAVAIAPASCIGHGLCERSCPMEAIELVFGTATRGVHIPRITADFETNVEGLYIVGELGGMGLIRNAFTQGRQCVDAIAARPRSSDGELLDLVIVGAGPAGLSASLQAQHYGLRFVTVDKEPDLGGTVRHYPRKKLVLTEPVKIPGFGRVGGREVLKEELMEVWSRIAGKAGLPLALGQVVEDVRRCGSGFEVRTAVEVHRARRVILAIGRRGIPRKLGVPGEELPNVQYALAEADSFGGDRVLVVGGGDSAIEAALALAEQGAAEVRLSYRRDRFHRIKPKNRERIREAESGGTVDIHWSTTVMRVESDLVWLSPEVGEPYAFLNDQVFVFAGGELPTSFLERCGVLIDTRFGAA
jgi:thioredoxin reductase (NADPH)